MKVLMISKALVVASYRDKLRELSALGIDLTALTPTSWKEEGREIRFEEGQDTTYAVIRADLAWNGHFHLHYYPSLGRIVSEVRPDILHIDEEPYNLATYLAFRAGGSVGARSLFFTWQNIQRRYPPPFGLIERAVYAGAAYALAGSAESLEILRRKGYSGPAEVIPQFGVNTDVFAPGPPLEGPFTVGFMGRLVPEKGIADLLAAFGLLAPPVRLILAGDGPMAGYVDAASASWRREGRFERYPRVPSAAVPDLLRRMDVVVLPSRTTKRWREQYGRILVEAMACGVSVIGSDSGEIPRVIDNAGVIFHEGDARALAQALESLAASPTARSDLAAKGRERAITVFSQRIVAEQTADVYRRMTE